MSSFGLQSVPLLVAMCVAEVEREWLDIEGIYRMAGSIAQVNTVSLELNKGNYKILKDQDVHSITSLLKKFLKELPDPVIPGGQF